MSWILNGEKRLTAGDHNFHDKRSNQVLAHLQLECITRVSEAIRDPARASSDAVILSVGCLINDTEDGLLWDENLQSPFQPPFRTLQWLDIYGSLSVNPVHWGGLVQLITLKEGLQRTELPALAALMS